MCITKCYECTAYAHNKHCTCTFVCTVVQRYYNIYHNMLTRHTKIMYMYIQRYCIIRHMLTRHTKISVQSNFRYISDTEFNGRSTARSVVHVHAAILNDRITL